MGFSIDCLLVVMEGKKRNYSRDRCFDWVIKINIIGKRYMVIKYF